jgi:hypothetical protein
MCDDHGERGPGVEFTERLRQRGGATIDGKWASEGRLIVGSFGLLGDDADSVEAERRDEKTQGGPAEQVNSHGDRTPNYFTGYKIGVL